MRRLSTMRVVVLRAAVGVALAAAVGQAVAGCGSDGKDSAAAPASAAGQASSAAACSTVAGAATAVAKPGVGQVTVTLEVCAKAVKSATAAISESNWEPKNTNAFAALNPLAVQYYKSDTSKITFSGATLTSNAYQASLKDAIAKAGI